jgi:glycosyltransferase involved in cell wall biosynthesis
MESVEKAAATDGVSTEVQKSLPTLLVMLPALNEAATVASVIGRIPRNIDGVGRVEVLLIDDGSTDDTVALARGAGASVISHGYNRGVGAALQTGMDEAIARRVDIVVNMDSDGQFSPENIRDLIQPILAGRADMATASRFKDPALVPEMPKLKRAGNAGMSWLVSSIVGQRFADVSCGFRAYSREAILRLVLTGAFTYTQETFLVLASKGMRIVEVPIPVRGVREHGESRVASNLFRYARRTSGIIFGSIRDYRPNQFFNTAAGILMLFSLCIGGFFVWYRITHGQFSPHIWAGFVSAFFFGLAVMVFALGQVALMVARLRQIQEQQLYLLRKLNSNTTSR